MTTATQIDFRQAFAAADAAGKAAAEAITPTPMIVQQHRNPLDDNSAVVKQYFVPQGPCGFAWVTIRPGTSALARYAKKFHGARKAYYGGLEIWISDYQQSIQLKEAYAYAFAAKLSELTGEKVYAGSRLD